MFRACRESNPRNAYTILDTLSTDRLGNQSYTAREARTGQVVIAKITELVPPVERYAGQRIITELFLMRDMLPHRNVGTFLDLYLYEKSELWMMTEYIEGGRTLHEIIARNPTAFTEERIAKICLDTCKGLAHLHKQLIIHRDMRSDSIIIDMKGRIKITGFGFSVQLPDKKAKRQTMVSTLNLPTRSPFTVDKTHWTSPEVIRRKEYGPEVDVWAFGITVVEMIDGAPPYQGEEPLKALFLILVNGTPELKNPDALSDELKDFLGNALDVDVECRSTSSELAEHGFLKRACAASDLAPLFGWEDANPEIADPFADEKEGSGEPSVLETSGSETIGPDQLAPVSETPAPEITPSSAPDSLAETQTETVDPPAARTLDPAAPTPAVSIAASEAGESGPETLDPAVPETAPASVPAEAPPALSSESAPPPISELADPPAQESPVTPTPATPAPVPEPTALHAPESESVPSNSSSAASSDESKTAEMNPPDSSVPGTPSDSDPVSVSVSAPSA